MSDEAQRVWMKAFRSKNHIEAEKVILEALNAERERAAKIVEAFSSDEFGAMENMKDKLKCGDHLAKIASAIRERP